MIINRVIPMLLSGDIHVHAEPPAELRPLEEIAHNLWWVWNEAKAILKRWIHRSGKRGKPCGATAEPAVRHL